MNRVSSISTVTSIILLGVLPATTSADSFSIDWYTTYGGGRVSSVGGDFELDGTIGQPDAGKMTGDEFTLTGGFLFGVSSGDCDWDGDLDLCDYANLADCLAGPDGWLTSTCNCFDLDGDGDNDLRDFATFQVAFAESQASH